LNQACLPAKAIGMPAAIRLSSNERSHDEVIVAESADAELKARLRASLVRHLRLHPFAGDTTEGMVTCWIPRRAFDNAPQLIEEIVESMVAAGELVATTLPDGRIFYQRGPAITAQD